LAVAPDFALRLKRPGAPSFLAFILLPYAEETFRGWRKRRMSTTK
jgi:hypothetical protein